MWIHESKSLRFLAANDSALCLYGYSRSDFLSLTARDLQTSGNSELAELLASGAPIDPNREWVTVKKDETQIYVRLYASDALARGRQGRFVVTEDVTNRRMAQAELVRMAHHDALTDLPNRILLEQRMRETFERARKCGHRVGVICMDLDRFKQVNDWYGHAIGDGCLKQVASMLTRRLRGMDTVARTGGEEFTLILGEVESVGSAGVVARALIQLFAAPVEVEGVSVLLGASCGVAVFPDHGSDSSLLWRSADAAMYRAKRAGGNRHFMVDAGTSPLVVPPGLAGIAGTNPTLERLQADGMQLHYQLQHTMAGKVRGVEALLRLPNAAGGFVSPERFIAIAEENGMIHPIGKWVIEEACRQIALWNKRRSSPLLMSVNVSPLQLVGPEFSEEVRRVIDRAGIDPAWLELEITERVVANSEDISTCIDALAKIGVRFAIDDFGTGYSSLLHLQRLPVSTLKIDRSFVRQLSEASRSYPIVNAMISMGHSLQMEVIAEGVETEDQRATLRKLGCDCIQGFLLSRPAAPEAIEQSF
jgi:diguanylate cyclase (GGDEF)-like protein